MVGLEGKRGLIMGVANERSIAWGIARQLASAGASLALSYQGEALRKRVQPLAEEIGASLHACDVTDEASMDGLFAALRDDWGRMDFLVHAIAFSERDELAGRYVETSRANFQTSLMVSCYSFTALARRAEALMADGGSLLTLSYLGAAKAIPHYNVMGVAKAALEASVRYLAADLGPRKIRVNAISAGPIKTLAAAGIAGMRTMLKWNQEAAPLRKNVATDEVGKAALYLLSDLSSAVTGEIHYVDAGYNIIGMHLSEGAAPNAQ
ncbi:MAG: SDR family oxidoreductase [Hyphomicrobiales bacterium]|nr:SDR family oxidoreductase [Hyphomicrobiales bacterium]